MSRTPRHSTVEEELKESFKYFDKDGNGYITPNELRSVMLNIGEKLTDIELEQMMKDVDCDKDGRINCDGRFI
jgi:calcium-binding protein CML